MLQQRELLLSISHVLVLHVWTLIQWILVLCVCAFDNRYVIKKKISASIIQHLPITINTETLYTFVLPAGSKVTLEKSASPTSFSSLLTSM